MSYLKQVSFAIGEEITIADAFELVLKLAKTVPERTDEQEEAINMVEDFVVNQLGDDDDYTTIPATVLEKDD